MLDGALDWITSHRRRWDERFDKLDAHLAEIKRASANRQKEDPDG
jgi:hypothetical protein